MDLIFDNGSPVYGAVTVRRRDGGDGGQRRGERRECVGWPRQGHDKAHTAGISLPCAAHVCASADSLPPCLHRQLPQDNWPTVEPYFNETGSNCPSVLPRSAQEELCELAVRSVQVSLTWRCHTRCVCAGSGGMGAQGSSSYGPTCSLCFFLVWAAPQAARLVRHAAEAILQRQSSASLLLLHSHWA